MVQVLEDSHSVVFISNLSGEHDYQPAAEFGALKPVTSGNYPVFKTHRLRDEIAEVLAKSTVNDYLLLSGSSMVAGLCMTYWLMIHDKVNLLLYDKKATKYVCKTVSRSELL